MTKLANYIGYLPLGRSYSETELRALQLVFDEARARLALSDTDPRRIRLAMTILELGERHGVHSPSALLEILILTFRLPR